MGLESFIRNMKNRALSNKSSFNFIIRVINMPIIGNIYDFFYLRYIRNKVNTSKFTLAIEPNNTCNLRCIMCPYKKMKRKKEIMSMQLFKKIVDQASEIGCKEVALAQYNEPFLDKDIFERIKYLRKKGIKSIIYSNGTLMGEEMRKKALENPPDTIRFSVDGATKKTFESIRIGANYENVVNNIIALYRERNKRKQNLPVIEVYFTILEKNKNETRAFLKFWRGKCDFASLYPSDSRESTKDVWINYSNLKSYPCLNPKRIYVLSNGKLAFCCIDVDGYMPLGDLKKQSLKEILNSGKLKKIYESQMRRKCNIPVCKNCSKYYVDSAFAWWFY